MIFMYYLCGIFAHRLPGMYGLELSGPGRKATWVVPNIRSNG